MGRRVLKIFGWVVLISLLVGAAFLYRPVDAYLSVMSAHSAKVVCSERFVAGRITADIVQQDIYPREVLSIRPFRLIQIDVNEELKRVESSLLGTGFYNDEAVYRNGLGCTLVRDFSADELQSISRPTTQAANSEDPWPLGERVTIEPNAQLEEALKTAFIDSRTGEYNGARAIVVVHKGKIIGERYAEGFDSSTPLPGWSMSKTVTAALAGFLIEDSPLTLESSNLFAEWKDGRANIQLKDLLSMSDGLDFTNGTNDPLSDELQQLYTAGDTVAYAVSKPAKYSPNENFNYNNGAPALVMALVRQQIQNENEWLNFPYDRLFTPLGMTSAQFETDAHHNFNGSSLVYASARDWARIGQLLLQNGRWHDAQLLPEGWAEYMVSPNSTTNGGWYSNGFIWLGETGWNMGVDIPADDYWLNGFDGQFVVVVPSEELVIVRMGLTQNENFHTRLDFMAPILKALEAQP